MKARLRIIISMLIFGTIGIFRRYIPLSSAMLAMIRGVIGLVFLLLLTVILKKPLSASAIRKNAVRLFFSGAFLGLNWVMLFEAYRYTTVATATLCYYLAPVFITFASPFILREKLTAKKSVCAVIALVGMVFVTGILSAGFSGSSEVRGILYGLIAAVLYAAIVLLNKKTTDLAAFDRTIVQLAVSSAVLLVYLFVTGEFSAAVTLTPSSVLLTLIVGIVHTGIAYMLYFSGMEGTSSQTAAVLSYLDPVTAILLSALFLHEPMGWSGVIGTVLVLGATLVSELPSGKRKS